MTQKRKSDGKTLLELPPKTEQTVTLTFSPEEARAYASAEKIAQDEYLVYRSHPQSVMKNNISILSSMVPLRKLCSGGDSTNVDPSINFGENSSSSSSSSSSSEADDEMLVLDNVTLDTKMNALFAALTATRASDSTAKCLVFSQVMILILPIT